MQFRRQSPRVMRGRSLRMIRTGHESYLFMEISPRIEPSPIVELNRAVAVSMASGPASGLELVNRLQDDPVLKDYHLLPSVRGDLLRKLGRIEEARAEFERAASITRNARERELLLQRARSCVIQ